MDDSERLYPRLSASRDLVLCKALNYHAPAVTFTVEATPETGRVDRHIHRHLGSCI